MTYIEYLKSFKVERETVAEVVAVWTGVCTLGILVTGLTGIATVDMAVMFITLGYFIAMPVGMSIVALVSTFVYWLIAKRG